MTAPTPKQPLVIGFVGENAYGCLVECSRFFNGLLATYGIEAHCINLFDADWSDRLGVLVADRTPLFCYGLAGVGAALKNGSNSFWTDYKVPFLSLMYDHPFCNLGHHTISSPYVANCYFIADFLETQLAYVQHTNLSFLLRDPVVAPAAPLVALSKAEHQTRWRARSIPYLFIKTGYDLARLQPSIDALPPTERAVFSDCLDILKKSADYNLTHLAAEQCRAKNIEPTAHNKNFTQIVLLLERAVRDWRSLQIVEWLKDKPALIIGNGWDKVDKIGAAAKFLPPVPAARCWELYNDARFVLNANPCFRDGGHERVLMGLNAGAVSVSDRNRFSDNLFADLENFVSFDWADQNWRAHLDMRLAEIEATGGDFDPYVMQQKLAQRFPVEPFVASLITIAQKVRDAAA